MRVLLALVGVLTFATSGFAECAWVLWTQAVVGSTQTQPPHPIWGEWKPEETFQNRETCKRNVAKYLATLTRQKMPDDPRPYVCLPDTVDPRGPKGK